MKFSLRFASQFFVLLLVIGVVSSLAGQFQGLIVMETGNQSEGKVNMEVGETGSIMNMELGPQTPAMTFLLLFDKPNQIYQLNKEKKTYSNLNLDALQQFIPQQKDSDYKVTKLGKKKIMGYETIHIKAEGDGEVFEAWLAPKLELAAWEKVMKSNPAMKQQGKVYDAFKKAGAKGFPLKVVVNPGAKNEVVTKVVEIEKKKFPKGHFSIPDDYEEVDALSGMLGLEGKDMPKMSPEQMQQMQKALQELMKQQPSEAK